VTRRLALVLGAVLFAGCGTTSPSAAPTTSPGSTATAVASANPDEARDAGWAADLDAIVPAIEANHPNPWHGTPRETLVAAVDQLKATIHTASDDELMVGAMRIVAMVSAAGQDAHTGVYVWGAGTYATHTLPLRLWVFPEGVAVVAAMPPYGDLVGRIIGSIDGTPVADVLATLDPLIPRDNPETVTLLAPRFLLTTEILHGAGVIDDPKRVTLGFSDDPSATIDVAAISTTDYNAWATPYGLHLPTRPDVPYLARSEEPIWFRVDAGSTLYIQYNRVARLAFDVLDPLRTALADPALTRVIVDVRHNYGGETLGYPPLVVALVKDAPSWSDGLYLIAGRNTFAAASLFTADLTYQTSVTVVGEPMGGSPSLYGNPTDETLPYSGLVVSVATQLYQPVSGDARLEIEPDLPVSLTLADFLAGRDPALEAIEARG